MQEAGEHPASFQFLICRLPNWQSGHGNYDFDFFADLAFFAGCFFSPVLADADLLVDLGLEAANA